MTRKKSRPTHRENAAVEPSNEGGFYKMFWNSMETNPGTNGPNSPSQGDVSLTSPPVIILSDSPAGSPCAVEENGCENLVPPPIKEETCVEAVNDEIPPSSIVNNSENPQESHREIDGDCASHTCLPDHPVTSPSKNNSPPTANGLTSEETSPQIANEVPVPSTSPRAEEGDEHLVGITQVGEQVTSEEHVVMFPDNPTHVGPDEPEDVSGPSPGLPSTDVSNLPENAEISCAESADFQIVEAISGIAEHSSDVPAEPQTTLETEFSGEDNEDLPMDDLSNPVPPSTQIDALSFLKSLLDAPTEQLEYITELPALVQSSVAEQHVQSGEGEMEFAIENSAKESHVDGACMEIDQSPTVCENALSIQENALSVQENVADQTMVVDEEEAIFPTCNNFLPKKIKLDSIGIARSVRALKDSLHALYKGFLKDDTILRTVSEPEPPTEEDPESSDEVQETPALPAVNYPIPICSVKVERLPEPMLSKSTITMSDDTFKIWKKKIIQQRNEEKFRKLKVWRRGRTLLWRECELAGMDRATYDEQVAYVKKHKLNENSSASDSGGDDSGSEAFHQCNSSSDEERDDGESNKNESLFNESVTSTDGNLPDNEYVVERPSSNRSTTKTPSALKITIRKTSTSKSEEDREKPSDDEVRFPVPAQRLGKTRKVATKRTFRRASDPVLKATALPKTTPADSKKPKNPEDEDLYDQSLLGTRSHEVENFNLEEKWDIPFEEPTLFRSPRAASRLAQLKTKEAFNPIRHRQVTQKSTNSSTAAALSKEVKEVVDFLCSKTVEAMLFPSSDPEGAKKHKKSSGDGKDSNSLPKPTEVSSKASAASEETVSNLDESSEMSQSETNSTLDASSDFGGSTASLASEDFVPPMNKSPPKSRRRRRGGPSWGKKKVKGKGVDFQSTSKQAVEKDEKHVGSPLRTDPPVAENVSEEKRKSNQDVNASHVHSTQVPVVSEGPGQSPHESEDDSARHVKEPERDDGSHPKVYEFTEEEPLPASVSKTAEIPKTHEVVPPRLTRSRQPTVQLDMELLQNFGARKRKSKVQNDVPQEEDSKKPKEEPGKKTQIGKPTAKITDDLSSTADRVTNDHFNTQVPEVSEGPGEVISDRENKRGQENKTETKEPPARMLRSRSRGPAKSLASRKKEFSESEEKMDERVNNDKAPDGVESEEALELESPQSPPPEPVEPEPLITSRVTRSKKRRSGPAYIAVKNTEAEALPSVCDIVDSIAGQRLPTPSKLFCETALKETLLSGQTAEPITVCQVQTPAIDNKLTPLITSPKSSSNEPSQKDGKTDVTMVQPPLSDSCSELAQIQGSALESFGQAGDSSGLEEGQPAAVLVDVVASSADVEKSSGDNGAKGSLEVEKPGSENVNGGRLEVLDTLNNILAVSSPTKESVGASSPPIHPALSVGNLPISPLASAPSSQPPVGNVSAVPKSTDSSVSLPTFPTGPQDISSILPGTFLNSFFTGTLDTNLASYSNMNDTTSLPEDPDGDLVIDEGDAPEADTRIDVNFWENLTNADLSDTNGDFSDDDNNTDLADKIDKIIKDQIHQDPVPVPSLKQKENDADANQKTPAAESDKNASALNRRDSIDERTGLPTNFIQRLRDPRIRSRLLSHLEEAETNSSAQSTLGPFLNSLTNNIAASTPAEVQPAAVSNSEPKKNVEGVALQSVGYPITVIDSSRPVVSSVATLPITGVLSNTVSSGLPTNLAVPPLSASVSPSKLPLVVQGPLTQPDGAEGPEQPPDPSKVDFLVPPSDDEEEESVKRRPSKKKKEVDVELMYKSPLEDLQSEARPAYGERAPRRYADNFPRRKPGDDRLSRRDDRRMDDQRDRSRFEERGRSRSRDRRFEERGRSQSRGRFEDRGRDRSRSRDRRSFYDRPTRDYDPYLGEEREITPHHADMQPPYSPWPAGNLPFNHQQRMMQPLPSPHWQPNYYPEANLPPHPPIFMPEPPKIDFMETRLINLELLPKTTNLEISPLKKVYSYFDKDSLQLLGVPPPTYDPNEKPETIKMMDPTTQEMIDFVQTPRPTSGLTKDYFKHVAPDLTLEDVVRYHFISPAYYQVRDNEDDSSSSSDEEDGMLGAEQKKFHNRKSELEHKERLSKQVLDQFQRRESQMFIENSKKRDTDGSVAGQKIEKAVAGVRKKHSHSAGIELEANPLQNLLRNLPLLRDQYSMQNQPPLIPPPPPEWNDVDLRIARGEAEDSCRNPSPPRSVRSRSKSPYRSRSKSPYRSRRSRSPRRRRRRSRSTSPASDMSISSRSGSRSPSYSRSRASRRRRSRSRSSERTQARRSRSPKRRSPSISPSRKYSRR